MSKRATLRDIAKASGVSVTTVSLVLNNHPLRVSPQKRELITRKAQELHYVPNQMARSLVTNQSMLLALLVPDIENPFFASFAKKIEDVCAADGYSLIIANSNDSKQTELNLLSQLESRGIDGLFLIPSMQSVESPKTLRRRIEHLNFPVILTDRLQEVNWCDTVGSNGYMGGELAAKALIDNGHTRLACISGDSTAVSANARKNGFMDSLKKAGVKKASVLSCEGDYRLDSGYQAADSIVDWKATGVFCCNDFMALGLLKRLEELDVRVPKDCSVIGYDNIAGRIGLNSDLATIDQNIPALADTCWRLMGQRIASYKDDQHRTWLDSPVHELIDPTLAMRKTVADIR
ncbi:LacI family DNA-binding transcriptional regulator [Bifidobacterium sp. ESL0800]|uniref:LacI family DNA-binding transcriptional regulator n=1 Tax=Bifidobacterium sp. ESL0800 TaxID=2983236 RepID=UPI0023F68FEC|nr:LacI family DNA-binding transcriptional regulator [Bifidobacterium sp. ESL0800]WEV75532.1 LacI family DNA-binding transcriptional regulator [Bifidobacterium sp. ESL0800]